MKHITILLALLMFQLVPAQERSPDLGATIYYLEQELPALMESYKIPGGVVTIVMNDSLVYNQGFGYSHWDTKTPVDPNNTVFRVASLSKIVTTIAALQQVEHKAIDMEADITSYLDNVSVQNPYKTPVTLFHLLTHTGGFDQSNIARRSLVAQDRPPLEKYLSKRMPSVVFEPGSVIAYSNHGMALAGYLVEKTSGQSYSAYVEDQIFKPLDMSSSSFDKPEQFHDRLAKGYNKEYEETQFEYLKTGPASMLMTTGTNMSHFMRMLLNEGNWEGRQILSGASVEKMLTTQFRNHPAAEGTE